MQNWRPTIPTGGWVVQSLEANQDHFIRFYIPDEIGGMWAMPSSPLIPAPRAYRVWRRAGWFLVVLLALLLLVGGSLLYSVLPYSILRPSRSERWALYHNATPADYGLSAEDLWVEAEPGVWLCGWHVETKRTPARGTIVLLHGHGSCKESMLGLAQAFSERGYNCLLYDSRAHGQSGGRFCTYGYYERRDVSRVLDEGERRYGPLGPVAIFGNSLGGAVALQTLPIDSRIRCGVVASSFATLREIIHDYMEHYSGVPFFFISNLGLTRAAQIAHFVVDRVSPEAAAGYIQQPVLLAHGTNDHWIAFRYGERIARHLKSPGSIWYPVTGADHNDVWQKGGPVYHRLIFDFVDQHCR
jgi:pimeloyl-ACP methyl ester carboxylesterase